ncbi:MAG: SDR family oxidoreductase [Spirochaetaceae bacterium]
MSSALFDLKGKIALVTGSHRGLGRAMAEGLAAAGATVVINGRHRETVDMAVAELRQMGQRAFAAPFDVTDEESIEKGMTVIEQEIGKPDILFNNAGAIIRSPLLEMSRDEWNSMLNVHLTGSFLLARRAVPGMIEKGAGKVVNTCSFLSAVARDTVSAYAAAKAGLKMLTQEMATEWGRHNVQCNAIGPGFFATDLTKPLRENEEFDSWLKGRVPAARWGEPEELIGPALFLASSASNFVNGQIIYVDGGLLARV